MKALCVKANRKVSAFARVANYIDFQTAKLLYQSSVASTFKCCPLIGMFCGKTANGSIYRVHKRALRILLDDYESTFEALLPENDETNIHAQNFRVLILRYIKHSKIPIHPSCRSILQEKTSNMTSGQEIHFKFLLQKHYIWY